MGNACDMKQLRVQWFQDCSHIYHISYITASDNNKHNTFYLVTRGLTACCHNLLQMIMIGNRSNNRNELFPGFQLEYSNIVYETECFNKQPEKYFCDLRSSHLRLLIKSAWVEIDEEEVCKISFFFSI